MPNNIPFRKYLNGTIVYVPGLFAKAKIVDAEWSGYTWVYSFEGEKVTVGESWIWVYISSKIPSHV